MSQIITKYSVFMAYLKQILLVKYYDGCMVVQDVAYANGQSNRKWQISPPPLPFQKPLNRFWWNLKLTPERLPHAKLDTDPTTWVVWTNTQFATVRFLSLSFFFASLCCVHWLHRWSNFDKLYVIQRLTMQECAYWEFCWYDSPFNGSFARSLLWAEAQPTLDLSAETM